jgi:hypothetical protein
VRERERAREAEGRVMVWHCARQVWDQLEGGRVMVWHSARQVWDHAELLYQSRAEHSREELIALIRPSHRKETQENKEREMSL